MSAPSTVKPSQSFVARLAAYTKGQEEHAERMLTGPRGKADAYLDVARCQWPHGTEVEVVLSGEHLLIESSRRSFTWLGEPVEATFDVRVSEAVEDVVLRYDVYANGIPVAHPRLEIDVEQQQTQQAALMMARATEPVETTKRALVASASSAFASYSSADRAEVLGRVSALHSIGIDVFTDCLDLMPGDAFKHRLQDELLTRDLYVLFWSANAKASTWVDWELTTVLDNRGEGPVVVNPIEIGVAPPARLAHLNFSDPAAWFSAQLKRDEKRAE